VAIPTAQRIRFGAFELDRPTGELFKHGTKLKLQGQPIAVLSLLLERPGELVTREELRKHLWPEDTFVDFEHSLNTHIKKLRQVFNDDAETPRYIETLPRRGYRFIAQVEAVANGGAAAAEAMQAERETPPDAMQPAGHPPGLKPIANSDAPAARLKSRPDTKQSQIGHGAESSREKRRWKYRIAVALILVVAAGALYRLIRPRTPVVTAVRQLTHTGRPKNGYVVTDGTRVYFDEIRDGKSQVAEVSTAGGEVSHVDTQLSSAAVQDISPDGLELLITSPPGPGPFWILPLPAGAPRRISGEFTGGGFLPGSSQIAYVQSSDFLHVFASDVDGGNAHALLQLPRDPATLYFVFSPNGSTIRYSTVDGKIWESRVDGTQKQLLSQAFREPNCLDWSAGNKLFLLSSPKEAVFNLWAISQSGWLRRREPETVQLTFGPVSFACPVGSKDGKHIYALGRALRGELNVYDAQAGTFRKYLNGISAGFTDFSRDGQWVAYVTHPQGDLWRSRIDGSERLQLTFPGMGPVSNPRWSPDGRLIVFDQPTAERTNIYLVSADGGVPLLLMSDNSHASDPSWSPDGKLLAYAGGILWMSADPKETRSEVRILDLSTKQSKTVPGSQGMFSPRWSPDGNYIAALSDDQKRLFLYSFEKQQWQPLHIATLMGAEYLGWPTWSHDSRYLYFMSPANVYKLKVPAGEPELVASTAGTEITCPVFPWVIWFGLTPDDHILMMQDRGVDEIYALDVEYR